MHHLKSVNGKMILWFVLFLTILLITTNMINTTIPIETGILGTVYTFFYGMFVNALFKFLDEKYLQFRMALAGLIGKAQSVYNVALLSGNKKYISRTKKELSDFIKSFNSLPETKYYLNQHHINKLYDSTRDLKVKTPKEAQQYSRLLSYIDGLSESREKLEIFGSKHLTRETKWIFISTTVIYIFVIGFITFAKTNFYMNLIGVLLMGMVVFIAILMFNLDNMSYGTHYVKTRNIEELADMIEKGKIETERDIKDD
jgi:hypothetical protein